MIGIKLWALAVMVAALTAAEPLPAPPPGKVWVYIGTYTQGPSKGIYRLELDAASGKLSPPELAAETRNPSFLAIGPGGRFLYAVGEVNDFDGKKGGGISAFAIDPATGKLTLLNQQSSGGAGPCHLTTDQEGKFVLAANYGGGSACVLPVLQDGKLGSLTAFVQHKGSSVNPKRQEGPHAHSINLDPAGRYAMVADLGMDKILVYRFDRATGKLSANDPVAAAVAPGAGPRHFAFHPSGKFAYVINELASTVTAFRYDPEKGVLQELESVSTLPPGFQGATTTAEVQVHPSGKFLYGSNRGHDSIAIFTIDEATGRLRPAGHASSLGKTPRNFGIDPSGRFLIAANQASNNLAVFRIDPGTGALTPTGQVVEVPAPVCVKFLSAGG